MLPQPAAVTSGDSHGGFHGDGLLHMELTFSQEDALAVEEAVSSAGMESVSHGAGTGGAPLPGRRRRVGLGGLGPCQPGDGGIWRTVRRTRRRICGSGTLTTIPLRSMTQIPASCTTRSWTPETGGMSEWTI